MKDYRLIPTQHSLKVILDKGFDAADVKAAFDDPKEVYESGSHPGQWRVCGHGLCLVGTFDTRIGTFTMITLYLDRVVTPVRVDQLQTPEGRRFAEVGRRG